MLCTDCGGFHPTDNTLQVRWIIASLYTSDHHFPSSLSSLLKLNSIFKFVIYKLAVRGLLSALRLFQVIDKKLNISMDHFHPCFALHSLSAECSNNLTPSTTCHFSNKRLSSCLAIVVLSCHFTPHYHFIQVFRFHNQNGGCNTRS